jgi:serine protease
VVRQATRKTARSGTMLLSGLSVALAAAAPAQSVTPGQYAGTDLLEPTTTVTFVDGGRPVVATRLGTEVSGRPGIEAVRFVYPSNPAGFVAGVDRRAIVRLRPASSARVRDVMAGLGLRPIRELMPTLGLWLVEDAAGVADGLTLSGRLAPLLKPDGDLRQAIPDLYLRHELRGMIPNDPRYPDQWYYSKLRMPDAWALSLGSADTTIVVVDNGCDLAHPDLAAKMDPGKDVITPDNDPSYVLGAEGNAHGTECAGIIGAVTNNEVGIAGGCPECRLRCVRMLAAPSESTPASADIEAFQFALEVDADVVSNSWGFVGHVTVPQPLVDAVNEVFDTGRSGRGALVIFAAGNDGRLIGDDELEAVRGVLCVSAVNNYDEATQFTNYGPAVDLAAPTGTVTTDISGVGGSDAGDYTAAFGGTSSACPVVAGIAGLLVSVAPDKTSAELYDILTRNARRAPNAVPDANGHDDTYGFGIVSPVATLEDALGLNQGGDPEGPLPKNSRDGCHCGALVDSPVWLAMLGLALGKRLRRRA